MEGDPDDNSYDFSPSYYTNYLFNDNNETNDAEDADPISMAWPDQSAAVPNNQSHTPFQASQAISDQSPQNVTNQTRNPFGGLLIPPFQQASSSHVHHQNIDLNPRRGGDPNPFAIGSSNSTPIVLSSGISRYVLEENNGNPDVGGAADGRTLSCKRRTPEESSSQSTHIVGESSRTNEEDYESQDDVRRVNSSGAGSVVIGLPAPTRQMIEEHQIRRNVRMRLSMDSNSDVSQVQQPQPPTPLPPQSAVSTFPFQYSIHPGFLGPSLPQPLMQLPVPHPAMPSFSQFASRTMNGFQRTGANLNRQARPPMVPRVTTTYTPMVSVTTSYTLNGGETVTVPVETSNRRILYPHEMVRRGSTSGSNIANIASSSNSNNHSVPPSPAQFVYQSNVIDHQLNVLNQYGQIIPVESVPQWSTNYTLQQHMTIPVEGRADHLVPSNRHLRPGVTVIPPRPTSTSVQQQIRALVAAAQSRNRIISEFRNAFALVRRDGYLQEAEDVVLIDDSDLDEPNDDVDEMTYEELLELEERIGYVSTGLRDDVILANLKHHNYALASSSEDVQCCICQEELKKGEDVGKLECRHEYHYNCIRQWLARKNNCPICKMIGLNV